MNTEEIIEKAKQIRKMGKTVIDIAENLGINIGYNNLDPKKFPAYNIRTEDKMSIILNSKINNKSRNVLCAHELGHALLHNNKVINHFGKEISIEEYEANLFAVALLFDEDDFKIPLNKMSNFELKSILDHNINLEPAF